jgi:serine/threonine protein phosphatase 1
MSEVRKLLLTDSKTKANRRFAISDIHGCFKTFKALLDQIALRKEDYLFIVGDAVNRGPDSAAILDEIIRLKESGYHVYYLRGNHEQAILDTIEKKPKHTKRLIRSTNTADLFVDKRIIKEDYHQILSDTYHFIELEDYFVVHAGFDFEAEKPFEQARPMLFINKFKLNKNLLKGKKVIVGHKPKSLNKILKRISANKNKIYIDNGCVNHGTVGQGNLVCFNLDSKALSIQKNIDLPQ